MARDYEPLGLCAPIKWEGGDPPLPPETVVVVEYRSGLASKARKVKDLWWDHRNQMDDIVAYRYWPDEVK